MHPLIFLALALGTLGVTSYGIMLTPLTPAPKQAAHFGVVVIFLGVVARYYNLL